MTHSSVRLDTYRRLLRISRNEELLQLVRICVCVREIIDLVSKLCQNNSRQWIAHILVTKYFVNIFNLPSFLEWHFRLLPALLKEMDWIIGEDKMYPRLRLFRTCLRWILSLLDYTNTTQPLPVLSSSRILLTTQLINIFRTSEHRRSSLHPTAAYLWYYLFHIVSGIILI